MKNITYKNLEVQIAMCRKLIGKNQISKDCMESLRTQLYDSFIKIPNSTNDNELKLLKKICYLWVICDGKMKEYKN